MAVDKKLDIPVSELALLAVDAYKVNSADCKRVGDDWWPWDQYGQRYCTTSQVGFFGRMYYSPTRKALVAAFRGTGWEVGRKDTIFEKVAIVVDGVDDAITDLKQFGNGIGVKSEQARLATEFIRGASSIVGYQLIGCVGHSLGGGLAHICAMHFSIPGVGFNPAPFDSFGKFDINKNSSKLRYVHSYVTEDDPVSNLSIMALFTKYRGTGLANGALVVKGSRGGGSFGHSMDDFAKVLQTATEGKHTPFAWTPAGDK